MSRRDDLLTSMSLSCLPCTLLNTKAPQSQFPFARHGARSPLNADYYNTTAWDDCQPMYPVSCILSVPSHCWHAVWMSSAHVRFPITHAGSDSSQSGTCRRHHQSRRYLFVPTVRQHCMRVILSVTCALNCSPSMWVV